jgi:hypothetical protein
MNAMSHSRKLLFPLTLSVNLLLGLGCGQGGSTFVNDPIPTGTVISQGYFGAGSVSGKSVTGVVSVYRASANQSNIVRLESLQAPDESPLTVVAFDGTGQSVYSATLRSSTGSQNYDTGTTGSIITKVSIRSPRLVVPYSDYGIAILQTVNTGGN